MCAITTCTDSLILYTIPTVNSQTTWSDAAADVWNVREALVRITKIPNQPKLALTDYRNALACSQLFRYTSIHTDGRRWNSCIIIGKKCWSWSCSSLKHCPMLAWLQGVSDSCPFVSTQAARMWVQCTCYPLMWLCRQKANKQRWGSENTLLWSAEWLKHLWSNKKTQ